MLDTEPIREWKAPPPADASMIDPPSHSQVGFDNGAVATFTPAGG